MDLLRVASLQKVFSGAEARVTVLREISFSLAAGERVALIGPSGCGKSTLLQIVAGLDRADAGSVQLEGRELARLSPAELAILRRRKLGIVFQFFNLFSSLSVLDNVLLPGRLDRRPSRELRTRALRMLERVGLAHKSAARVGELSGGEMQRAAIGRALLLKPKLLLADEPTGNLDSDNRGRIYGLLRELCAEEGVGVLMATHDPEASGWADRCLEMRDGRVHPA